METNLRARTFLGLYEEHSFISTDIHEIFLSGYCYLITKILETKYIMKGYNPDKRKEKKVKYRKYLIIKFR